MGRAKHPPHPGEVLRGYLGGMSVAGAAKHLGVTRAALSRILNGHAGISAQMALRLSDLLFVSTYQGYEHPWDAASLEIYSHLLGSWMGWDSARQAREIMLVLEAVKVPGVTH